MFEEFAECIGEHPEWTRKTESGLSTGKDMTLLHFIEVHRSFIVHMQFRSVSKYSAGFICGVLEPSIKAFQVF
jgi:hypothetical protein